MNTKTLFHNHLGRKADIRVADHYFIDYEIIDVGDDYVEISVQKGNVKFTYIVPFHAIQSVQFGGV